MKCAIYARVSTDSQETSIINQQDYFKDYIKRHNFEIFDIYTDEAFSGTETSKRLSFQRLLQDGKNKRYDVLLAKSYSRFGRNQRETLTALAELFEHGIRIIFVEDGLDSQRDKGQFGLFAWLAEQESRKISERMKLTISLYHKEGKIHTTKEAYGYNYDKSIRNFVVNEEEAVIVRMIFDLYLQGKGFKNIANILNEKGIPSKRNSRWCMTVITYMILNEFYIGSLVQGKRRSIDITIKKPEKIDKKDWFVHKNHHEAIISDEIFHKAQEEYEKRSKYLKQYLPTHHSNLYLFSNLVKCKICGEPCVAKKASQNATRNRLDNAYICKSYMFQGLKGSGHRRNAIYENILLLNVKSELETLAENDYKIIKDYYKQSNAENQRKKAMLDISTLDKQIEK